jgi:predicted nuclease with TOPRIM domain
MSANAISDHSLRARLAQFASELTEVLQLVDQVQAERDQLKQRVEHLEAECRRLGAERSQLLHAWADTQITEEELDRRSREPRGCSLAELFQKLENIGSTNC